MTAVGGYAVLAVMAAVSLAVLLSGDGMFSELISGVRSGISLIFRLLPTFIIVIVSTRMLLASGAVDVFSRAFSALFKHFGIPGEVTPIIFVRPISSSGAFSLLSALYENSGADGFSARLATVIVGSCDAMIFSLSLYFSSVGIKKTRYALPCAFLMFGFCVAVSVIICNMFFG